MARGTDVTQRVPQTTRAAPPQTTWSRSSLYLVMPPSDIDRIRPLIRLLLNQFGRRLTERMDFGPTKAYRHQLLLLLDEFPSLGKLAFFEVQLALLTDFIVQELAA